MHTNETPDRDDAGIPGSGPPDIGAPPHAPLPPDDDWFAVDEPDPAAVDPPTHRRSARSWVVGGVGALTIAAAAFFGINAAGAHSASTAASATAGPGGSAMGAAGPGGMGAGGPGGMGGGTSGTIATIDGSTLTVKTSSGTTTVTTSASTAVTEAEVGSISDIAVGDSVMVQGTTSGTKVSADSIVDRGDAATAAADGPGGGGTPPSGAPPGGAATGSSSSAQAPAGAPSGGGRPVGGTVTKVSGSSITVEGRDGTIYTVTASSDTTIEVDQPATLADLAVGDTVRVMGATATDGTVTASRIAAGGS